MLIDRKMRLEKMIAACEQERAKLQATLEARSITDERLRPIEQFIKRAKEGVQKAGDDYEAKRWVIEMMEANVVLSVEGGEQIARFYGISGDRSLSIAAQSLGVLTGQMDDKSQLW
jgi:hypothetical protein